MTPIIFLVIIFLLTAASVFVLIYKKGKFATQKLTKIIQYYIISVIMIYLILLPYTNKNFSILIPMSIISLTLSLDAMKGIDEYIIKIILASLSTSSVYLLTTLI